MTDRNPIEKADQEDRKKSGDLDSTKDLVKTYEMTRKAIAARKLAKTNPTKDTTGVGSRIVELCTAGAV